MANGKLPLSIEGEEKLYRILSEFGFGVDRRPEALKMALAKGISTLDKVPDKRENKSSKFTIGEGVVARGDEFILYKSLIVERVAQQLDAKTVDDYMLRFIEEGIDIMVNEIESLSNADNYLIYLIEKHKV